MLFTHSDSRHLQDAGNLTPLRLANPQPQPGRERVRHIVMGSPSGVRSTIHLLHVLQYAEQAQWSRVFTIPESGIVLTPEQGEVFSYLLRWRSLIDAKGL